ncbi:MAG: phage tail protein [Plesiomonas sp.]|uniref:phage tail protein n=1 Tax=Plesiomonas sp. TaxID=2486279 RepID=UPI003F2E4D74
MSGFNSFGHNSLKSLGRSAGNNFLSGVIDRTTSMIVGGYGIGGSNSEIQNAKMMAKAAMQILYAQGWQWTLEADGFRGMDMFVKDITYGSVTIETESKQIGAVVFNKPTHRDASTVSMTVRDTEDGAVAAWFDDRVSRVVNGDGTVNLPFAYVMDIRLYRVTQSGQKILDETFEVFPTVRGETTRSRDQVTEFLSYPLTFTKKSSVDSGLKSMIGSALSKAASGTSSPANIIKF